MRGETEDFRIKVGEYHSSALSLNQLSVIEDEVTKEIQVEVPWHMIFNV